MKGKVLTVCYNFKLSICMMVKDEEKNLKRCLESLKPLVESGLAELIIIDTGSQDSTISIAKEYTDKLYFHKWDNNFSDMRNKTISYAKGEWIFIIDADERLDKPEMLIDLMNSSELKKFNSIIIKVKNLYNLKKEDNYSIIYSPRLFKNDGEFRYEGSVHNQPIFKGPELNTDISLTHYGYINSDRELMEKKFKRTTELLKEELRKYPKNLYYIYQLGISYDMHNDHKDALEQFRKAGIILKNIKSNEKKSYTYIYSSHARIAYINNELNEAIRAAKEALSLKKDYVDMYFILGLTESKLGNLKAAFDYFNEYISLVKMYNRLDISKDLSIIMYHVDKNSISTANYQIFQYYFINNEYPKAYNAYKNITNINEKILSGINILTEFKNFKELKKMYDELSSIKDKNTFLCTFEDKIKKLNNDERLEIYRYFSSDNDIYGLFNQLRLLNNKKEIAPIFSSIIEGIDFNKDPLFYAEIFIKSKADCCNIIGLLKNVEAVNLRSIFMYLAEKDKELVNDFEDYILSIDEKQAAFDEICVLIELGTILLLNNIKDGNEVNNKYLSIFKKYIAFGISYVLQIYKIDYASILYKKVNNQQDRFFIIMYIVKNLLIKEDRKSAINYMIEAVNTYEAMSKYIDIYKNELFVLQEENNIEKQNQQMENYKIKVKENINQLINQGLVKEAVKLINEYESIVNDDIEIFSMKAVISILENKLEDAEAILKEGIDIDNNNFDLNYNLGYLYEQRESFNHAVEYYKKAFDNCKDEILKADILSLIEKISSEHNIMPMISKNKIAFFVKQGMDSFLGDIINELSNEYEIKKIIVTDFKQIDVGMEWADICWFEWCDELIGYGSKHLLTEKKKIICRIHGYEVYTEYIKYVNWKNVNDLIIVAPHIRRIFEKNTKNISKGNLKIHTVFCGINLEKYPLVIKKKGFKLGYLGYINYKKNIPLTLDIFKKLYDSDNRYKLYLAGEYQDARSLAYVQYFIQEHNLSENIIFDGWQNEYQKIEWFKKIDYMIISSIDEGLCFAAAEAMCSGIKPILHNCEGLRDHYDKKYIFNTVDEACKMITSNEYNSHEYRNYIYQKYNLKNEMDKIKNIIKFC